MELSDGYYPQEKRWFGWQFIDNLVGGFTWGKLEHKYHSKCDSFDYAKRCIERRKEWVLKGNAKPIYHDIK